jgi:hypothetical protein
MKADAGKDASYDNVPKDCSRKGKSSTLVSCPATTQKTEKGKPTLCFSVRENSP